MLKDDPYQALLHHLKMLVFLCEFHGVSQHLFKCRTIFLFAGHWKIIEPVSGRIAGKLDMVGVIFRQLFREKTRTTTFQALQTLDAY